MAFYADAKRESYKISEIVLRYNYDKHRGETMRKSTYNFDTRERDTKAV